MKNNTEQLIECINNCVSIDIEKKKSIIELIGLGEKERTVLVILQTFGVDIIE